MNILSLFGSCNVQHSQKDKQLSQSKAPIPLCLPEILLVIFSFLGQYTLTHSVRYVCRLWLAVAHPLTSIRAVWHNSLNRKERHAALLDHLHLVTDLNISPGRFWYSEGSENLWRILSERIDNLRTSNRLHITKIELTYVPNLVKMVYPVLLKISTLTEIHVNNLSDRDIHLGAILALCPKLRLFHIENRWKRDHRVLDKIPYDSESPLVITDYNDSAIEQLSIKGMRVRQTNMQAILGRCPRLRVLKLNQVHDINEQNSESFDRNSFFAAVANSCRRLKSFHFSLYNQDMTLSDSISLIRELFPSTQKRASNSAQLMVQSQRSPMQINLDTVSLLDRDVNASTNQVLLGPLVRSSFDNIITTLEIIPAIEELHSDCVTHALHSVLCSSPSLLHVLAPTVEYFVQYFDLSETTDTGRTCPVWSCVSGCFASEPDFTKRKIWACRGLRTLQLKFVSKVKRDNASLANARMMFGYISKVCPNLRELAIYRLKLNLELESGLCLLSRLRFLQRLTVMTWTNMKLKKKDLKWMAKRPDGKLSKPYSRLWSTLSSSSRKEPSTSCSKDNSAGTASAVSISEVPVLMSDLTVESLRDVASAANLKACRNQLEQGLGSEGCWPMLEFLGIRHGGTKQDHPTCYLPALIKDIRPGVEFSCNYEELLKVSL
ncbi:hypothetical protein BGX26_009952 [Mortierella sp. AD094]|nr:hypothetical protein BGX26_009952 [Mortierella sp. AD094]